MKPRSHNSKDRRAALRDCAVLITALIFILGGGLPAMIAVLHSWGAVFAIGPDHVITAPLAFCGFVLMLLALVIGGYAGIIVWMLFGRFIFGFTRAEVARAARSGPRVPMLSAFDEYLIERIFRHTKHDA